MQSIFDKVENIDDFASIDNNSMMTYRSRVQPWELEEQASAEDCLIDMSTKKYHYYGIRSGTWYAMKQEAREKRIQWRKYDEMRADRQRRGTYPFVPAANQPSSANTQSLMVPSDHGYLNSPFTPSMDQQWQHGSFTADPSLGLQSAQNVAYPVASEVSGHINEYVAQHHPQVFMPTATSLAPPAWLQEAQYVNPSPSACNPTWTTSTLQNSMPVTSPLETFEGSATTTSGGDGTTPHLPRRLRPLQPKSNPNAGQPSATTSRVNKRRGTSRPARSTQAKDTVDGHSADTAREMALRFATQ